MAYQELINELIDTYRSLNLAIRGTPDDPKKAIQVDPRLREILRVKRDHELQFSQRLKERVTGVPVDRVVEDETPTLGTEQISDEAHVILSQFGTAREATLSLVRDLDEEGWNAVDASGTSIRAEIERLIDNDHQVMNQVRELLMQPLGSAAQSVASAAQSGGAATASASSGSGSSVPLDARIASGEPVDGSDTVTKTRLSQ